jgi:hypothetical protein|tara:strand:+ start:385 stop:711 length:327 start_codon:yes stop_codon:yes gene_type:complete
MNKNKIQALDYLRKHYVDDLRIAMSLLQKVTEDCLKKIEIEGVSGHYSANSEISRYTSKAWRASWALSELKRLEEKLAEEIDLKVEKRLEELLESVKKSNSNSEPAEK